MVKNYSKVILAIAAFAFVAPWPVVWAQGGPEFIAAAARFRDAARDVYQQGSDLCSGGCEPELSGPLANLGASLGPLDSAIAGGNPQQIQAAIANTASTVGPLCNALRVDCPVSPAGAVEEFEKLPSGADYCFQQCVAQERACEQSARSTYDSCINHINEYVACRLQTPFCDWRSAPFDPGTYGTCRATAYYRQFLDECRCQVPPGQGERQGGCPLFFTQGVGQVGTGACEVSDGLGCARCCNAKCVGADSRLSCQGRNREECDVCEWSRRTLAAGSSMRTAVCEAPFPSRLYACYQEFSRCEDSCPPPCTPLGCP